MRWRNWARIRIWQGSLVQKRSTSRRILRVLTRRRECNSHLDGDPKGDIFALWYYFKMEKYVVRAPSHRMRCAVTTGCGKKQ